MGWTPETIEALNRLWAEGKSITEIGKLIGMTRNAVVGKAHRLGLAKRPSPIARAAGPRPAQAPRKVQPRAAKAVVAPAPARPAKAPVFRPTRIANGPACRWPIGDPKTDDFHFCGDPSIEGKPYCEKHCAMAYSGWTEAVEKAEKTKAA